MNALYYEEQPNVWDSKNIVQLVGFLFLILLSITVLDRISEQNNPPVYIPQAVQESLPIINENVMQKAITEDSAPIPYSDSVDAVVYSNTPESTKSIEDNKVLNATAANNDSIKTQQTTDTLPANNPKVIEKTNTVFIPYKDSHVTRSIATHVKPHTRSTLVSHHRSKQLHRHVRHRSHTYTGHRAKHITHKHNKRIIKHKNNHIKHMAVVKTPTPETPTIIPLPDAQRDVVSQAELASIWNTYCTNIKSDICQ